MRARRDKTSPPPVGSTRGRSGSRFSARAKIRLFGGIAIVVLLGLIVGTRLGTGGDTSPIGGVDEIEQLFTGIPQEGVTLGDPNAPVTLIEYADLQCPHCKRWASSTLPVVVSDYVRTGKLKIVFRGLSFLGQESFMGLVAVQSAAEQNMLWPFVHALYAHQGDENSGWLSAELLDRIAASLELDLERWQADLMNDKVIARIDADEKRAADVGVEGTPSFELGPSDGALSLVAPRSTEPEATTALIDSVLAELAKR